MDKNQKEVLKAPPIDANRRRLTKAGLAAPAVLGTLATRQVLGADAYNCTPSGQISGNMSRPGAAVCSEEGLSPAEWADTPKWPSPYVSGKPADGQCPVTETLGTRFHPTFADIFRCVPITEKQTTCDDDDRHEENDGNKAGQCIAGKTYTVDVVIGSEIIANQSDLRWKSGVSPTMQQVLETTSTDQVFSLARAAIASLLSAAENSPGFPISADRVIEMFNTVYNGSGQYKINDSTYWNDALVQAYFESLYQ